MSMKAGFLIEGALAGRISAALMMAIGLARDKGLDDCADRYEQALAELDALPVTTVEVKEVAQ